MTQARSPDAAPVTPAPPPAARAPRREDFRFAERLRVRWAEVDAQNIVFNGHYLMYLDTAISGYWRALAMPYAETLADLGGDLFVRRATVEYASAARYDERLEIGLRCASIGRSSLRFQAAVFREGQLLVSGELVYVFADAARHGSRPVPDALRQALDAFEAGEPSIQVETDAWSRLGPAVMAVREQAGTAAHDDGPGSSGPGSADEPAWHAVAFNRFGRPIAAGRLVSREPGHAWLDGLQVHPQVQGAGFGGRMTQALADAARERGCQTLLAAVRPSARGFFLRQGFVELPAQDRRPEMPQVTSGCGILALRL